MKKQGRKGKYLKQTQHFKNFFGVARNSTIGEEMGKKRGVGEEDLRSKKKGHKSQNPYVISLDRLIRKSITSFYPSVLGTQMFQNVCPSKM